MYASDLIGESNWLDCLVELFFIHSQFSEKTGGNHEEVIRLIDMINTSLNEKSEAMREAQEVKGWLELLKEN